MVKSLQYKQELYYIGERFLFFRGTVAFYPEKEAAV